MGRPRADANIDPNATDLASIIARTMRICTCCKGMKPKTADYFYFKRTTGRFSSRCILCLSRLEKESYQRNRLEYLARRKAINDADPSAAARRRRAHYVRHKERINASIVARVRNSPILRLRAAVRARFHKMINGKGGRSWQDLVGYTVHDLKRHIDALLPPEWNWNNYGSVWVIDHKRPIASFDLPRQIVECWALNNLQPLERLENHRKGAKIIDGVF